MSDDRDNQDSHGPDDDNAPCPECGRVHPQPNLPRGFKDIARRMTLGMQAIVTKAVGELPDNPAGDPAGDAQAYLIYCAVKLMVFFGSANAFHMAGGDATAARNLTGRAISSASHEFDEFVRSGGTSQSDIGAVDVKDPNIQAASADELTDQLVAQAELKAAGGVKH